MPRVSSLRGEQHLNFVGVPGLSLRSSASAFVSPQLPAARTPRSSFRPALPRTMVETQTVTTAAAATATITMAAPSIASRGLEVWRELLDANAAYAGKSKLPPPSTIAGDLRQQLASEGQKPVAVVVSCSDSRVPPELVFASGLGSLFVIRTAGASAVDVSVLGSVEYAVTQLGVPLVIVMGHTKCGAVGAGVACANDPKVANGLPDNLSKFVVNQVVPVVKQGLKGASGKGLNDEVGKFCVKDGVEKIRNSSQAIADLEDDGQVTLIGAVYDITTGLVCEV